MTRPLSPPPEPTPHMPRSLKEALAKGAPYYLGSVCKRNHSGVRFTDSRGCVQCGRDQTRTRKQLAKLGTMPDRLLMLVAV